MLVIHLITSFVAFLWRVNGFNGASFTGSVVSAQTDQIVYTGFRASPMVEHVPTFTRYDRVLSSSLLVSVSTSVIEVSVMSAVLSEICSSRGFLFSFVFFSLFLGPSAKQSDEAVK